MLNAAPSSGHVVGGLVKFSDLNPNTMPGYGDPETWGGRTPYGEAPDEEDEMEAEELVRMAAELNDWLRNDKFAQQAVLKVLSNRGFSSVGQMASDNPELFLELHESIKTMREELPWT